MSLRKSISAVPGSPHCEVFHTEPPGCGGAASTLVREPCSRGRFLSRKCPDRSQSAESSRPPELPAPGSYSAASGVFSLQCIGPLSPVTGLQCLTVLLNCGVVPGVGRGVVRSDVPGAFHSVYYNMEGRDKGRDRSSRSG